ncbi:MULTISPECIES: hypothetical protein [Pirellulaceae]|uniref:hypothetical protein n=1 Tax=Pirellulaceae TaxID=2691357 RepID=UPI0011B09B89|nr:MULTISPECIES: hypothetical protein [Pirellulaceae]
MRLRRWLRATVSIEPDSWLADPFPEILYLSANFRQAAWGVDEFDWLAAQWSSGMENVAMIPATRNSGLPLILAKCRQSGLASINSPTDALLRR